MGNLLGSHKVGGQEESLGVGSMTVPLLLKSLQTPKLTGAPKKKVRFQVEDGLPGANENSTVDGVVKFRIAVSREELQNIVLDKSKGTRYSSVEEMLQGMKVTSRQISDVITTDDGKVSQKWKSELEFLAKKQ